MRWMRLTARGRAGHGSLVHDDNAVTALAEAVARLGRHQFPVVLTDSVEQFLTAVAEETGYAFDPDSPDLDGAVAKLGLHRPHRSARRCVTPPTRRCCRPATRPTSSPPPPRLSSTAGCYRVGSAAFEREVDEIIGPDVTREWIAELPSYETTVRRRTARGHERCDPRRRSRRAHRALHARPAAPTPSTSPGLGIRCFGFAPLRLPPDLDFAALFHGVDERVPVDALTFGAQVLEHFLLHC